MFTGNNSLAVALNDKTDVLYPVGLYPISLVILLIFSNIEASSNNASDEV
jgi:hypothetical protein